MKHLALLTCLSLPFIACAPSGGRVLLAEGWMADSIQWTDEQKAQAIAVVESRRTEQASYHVVRLKGAEKPHVHDRHDLTVFVLTGRVRMHLGDDVFEVGPADVIEIPHGRAHWAENIGPDAAEAYILFTPPFDGKDRRFVD